ncbi:MAG: LacI family DNA-binding transcriptional regulator [Oscillospiraceae bacterium]|nr:LacI family DNA-binding transcriptional regulator [Oscillospiraceae bacterium]
MKKKITLTDIAKACNTSNVTISKALAGKSGVSDELRAKIISTAEELGYVSSKLPASLGGNIGILIPEKFINPNGSFYWALYNSLVQRFKKKNISCIQENITTEEEAALEMPKLLTGHKTVGIISLGQLNVDYIKKLMELKSNILLLDYYMPGIEADCIVTNGFFGGYKLTTHLIAQGHTEIGYVGTRLATSSIFDRYMGYMKAMMEHKLMIKDEWIICDREINNELFPHITFPDKLPTALVCNCDETAFKVIRDLKARGVSVPDDVSVVGYDNYLISEISDPPITTINVDAGEMADLAVSTILERIGDPKIPTRIQTIDGKLVIKGSVKSIN